MPAMHVVKPAPLAGCQGPQHRVRQDPRALAEAPFGICQRCVHGNQCVVESAKRFVSQSSSRHGVFGCFDSAGEPSQAEHIKAAQAMAECALHRLRASGFHSA